MLVLRLLSSPSGLHFRLGTSDRVSTGNGLQPLLEQLLILISARPSRFHEPLSLALRLLRCPRHVQITP